MWRAPACAATTGEAACSGPGKCPRGKPSFWEVWERQGTHQTGRVVVSSRDGQTGLNRFCCKDAECVYVWLCVRVCTCCAHTCHMNMCVQACACFFSAAVVLSPSRCLLTDSNAQPCWGNPVWVILTTGKQPRNFQGKSCFAVSLFKNCV